MRNLVKYIPVNTLPDGTGKILLIKFASSSKKQILKIIK